MLTEFHHRRNQPDDLMNEKQTRLHIGLADFPEPTLLLLGDASSFNWLADRLEDGPSLDFAGLPDVEQVNVKLKLELADEGHLVRCAEMITWRVSLAESEQFAEQLRMLAVSDVPAHTYLSPTSNSSDVQIVASLGEYSAGNVFDQRLNTMKTILIEEPRFYGSKDERHFFGWLEGLAALKAVNRTPVGLELSFESPIDDESLVDLLGLLTRYRLDRKSLRVFLHASNQIWFGRGKAYWHKSVFGQIKLA